MSCGPRRAKRYGVFAVCDGGFAKMIAGLLPPEGAETAEQ